MPSIPDLLPYLCDRSDQKYELSDALKRHTEVETDRPLLFIVHGNEMEAHDKFLERLQRVILPKLLPRQTERVGVPSYQLEWPSRFRTPKEMKNRLTFSLSMEVLGYDVNLLEEICAHLGEGPVIIHSHVITENWQQERMSGLDAFVEFWQDWPDLAVEQKLLVFLFVKYQGNKSFSPHKLRQYRRINREILEALEKYDFARVSRLTAAVLTELKGPTQDETEAWARSEEAGKFCDCQALVKATGEYYTQWAREHPRIIPTRIPTDELVPKLMEMISRTQLFRGKVA